MKNGHISISFSVSTADVWKNSNDSEPKLIVYSYILVVKNENVGQTSDAVIDKHADREYYQFVTLKQQQAKHNGTGEDKRCVSKRVVWQIPATVHWTN